VFAISLVISIVLGTGEAVSIAVIVCLTLFYTFEGGMTAVIWTDVVQMILYIGGAIASFFLILHLTPGGWPQVMELAHATHKLQVFDFRFSLTGAFFQRSYTFWAGLLGGCFLVTASHGTEQLLVQRLLSAKSESDSRLALLSSWVVVFFQFALFLFIGLLLYAYYKNTGQSAPAVPERTYPEFIWRHLPVGLAGLVMAAILAAAMSNLSAALNALASTTIMDFLKPLRPHYLESYYLLLARWATVLWAIILFSVGLLARHWGRVLEAGLSIASVLYGALLGVFLLGVLTKRPGEWSAIIGMSAGFLATLLLRRQVAFTWYVLIGSSATFAAGYLSGLVIREPVAPRIPTPAAP
jgi:SSS family solute:Na+ symporter